MKLIQKAHLCNYVSLLSPLEDIIAIGNNFNSIVLYNLKKKNYTSFKCSSSSLGDVIVLKNYKHFLLALVNESILCWKWSDINSAMDNQIVNKIWSFDMNLKNAKPVSMFVDRTNQLLFVGLSNSEIRIWNIVDAPKFLGSWFNKNHGMVLSLEGVGSPYVYIYAGYENGSVLSWDISNIPTLSNDIKPTEIKLMDRIKGPITVIKSAVSSQKIEDEKSDWLIIGGQNGMIMWNFKIDLIGATLKIPDSSTLNASPFCVTIIDDYVIAGFNINSLICIWNLQDTEKVYQINVAENNLSSVVFDILPVSLRQEDNEVTKCFDKFVVCTRSSVLPVFSVLGYLHDTIEL